LDAGCEYKNYASDITRTFPISGTWSAEGKRIYDLVASMQEQCIEMVKPGIPYKDLQDRAMRVGVEGLLELGVLKDGTADEIIEAGTGRAFFPHGLGHHIGLECHDVDGQVRLLQVGIKSKHQLRSPKRFTFGMFTSFTRYTDITLSQDTRALESGMVITIEPGIYFLRYAMDLYKKMPEHNKYIDFDAVETYYKVGGVRIEDDLLVTDDGYENLTTAPKGEEALELIKKYSSAAK
jgi:Xaa-Pro dipeptidase